MKRQTTLLLLLAVGFGVMPILADTIVLNESKIVWPQDVTFISGFLILCNEAPASFFAGPCGDPPPTDVIVFDNAKHEAIFLSNEADGGGEPADIPFTTQTNNIKNPRFVLEPSAVNGVSTYIWAPGENAPGFYGIDKTWTIVSNDQVVPEPSSFLLMATALALAFLAARLLQDRPAAQRAAK